MLPVKVSASIWSSCNCVLCLLLWHLQVVTDSDRVHLTLLQVVYEDEHMACIVKPQGIPTAQVWHCSVACILMHHNALVSYLPSMQKRHCHCAKLADTIRS